MVYLIATIDITDRQQYKQYEAAFRSNIANFPGEILVVEEAPEILEGDWPHSRTVVMRFADDAMAQQWYRSDAYQRSAELRFPAARTRMVLARGLR